MHFSANCLLDLKWVVVMIIILISNIFILTLSDPRIEEAGLFCDNSKPPPNTTTVPTFVEEMEKISKIVSNNNWAHSVINHTTSTSTGNTTSTIPMFCLAQCFQDLSHMDCLSCFAASRTRLPRCLPALSARLYLDGCFLRYDTYNFFNQSVDSTHDTVNCSTSLDDRVEFEESVGVLIDNVTRFAVFKGGFSVVEVKGVFGLAQCWKSLSQQGCRECLEKASKEVRGCLPSKQGRGLIAGCYLRYSDYKFYNERRDRVPSFVTTDAHLKIRTLDPF